ncbi:hypothetical protein AX16_002523 [Volvariella volvacea WC 439]|nr:hypothetical protein AX16_002523 [Volvariella volvacea WC 439]
MLPSHIQIQLAELDAEISVLEFKLRQLRQRRNSLIPLNTLPPELISKVIQHVVDDTVTTAERRLKAGSRYGLEDDSLLVYRWVAATQLCMDWRGVALSHSALWTHIWTTNLEWVKVFLERSKSRLVYVNTWRPRWVTGSEYDQMLRLLSLDMDRVYSLNLSVQFVDESIIWLENAITPQLEVLTYSGRLPRSIRQSSFTFSPGGMAKLRQLELVHCSKKDYNCILPSHLPALASVTLTKIPSDNQLELLSCCNLAKIHYLSIRDGRHRVSQSLALALPNLRRLIYYHDYWSVLDCLVLPPMSFMEIGVGYYPEDWRVAGVFAHFTQALERLTRSGSNAATSLPYLSLSYVRRMLSVTAKSDREKNLGTFKVQVDLTNRNHPLFFAAISHLSHSADIHIRSININPGTTVTYDPKALFQAFRDHPRISTLHIQTFAGFISLLSLSDTLNPACRKQFRDENKGCDCTHCHDMRVSSFPGLQALVLNLGTYRFDDLAPSNGNTINWLEMLLEWLWNRKERGLELDRLELRYAYAGVESDNLSWSLSQVVTNVTIRTS